MRVIRDDKFDFLEDAALRKELRRLIMKAGRRRVLFVEGYDDKIIFEILYKEYLEELYFVDTSMKVLSENYPGGCEAVKSLLQQFVAHLPNERRFFGVIDRDLRFDKEVEIERSLPAYDRRLFIFFERYTLENYFVEVEVLCDFLHDKSIGIAGLKSFVSDDNFRKNVAALMDEVLDCLTKIGAANLAIKDFNPGVTFLEKSIDCESLERRVLDKLKHFSSADVRSALSRFESMIREDKSVQKFASAKLYFSYQFNRQMKKKNVDIQFNRHKSELAKILKDYLHEDDEFHTLLRFVGVRVAAA